MPSDGQIRFHGMGGPRGYFEAQLASQFGRAPRIFLPSEEVGEAVDCGVGQVSDGVFRWRGVIQLALL